MDNIPDELFEKYTLCLDYLCGFFQPNTTVEEIVNVTLNQVRGSLETCDSTQTEICHINASARDPFSWKTSNNLSAKCMNDAIQIILNGMVGPTSHGKDVMLPYVLIIAILCVTGLIGNALTITVILSTKSLRTSINYYLLSLALSDLVLVTITGPREVFAAIQFRPWIFGNFFCICHYYIIEAATYCTIMSITAVSIERYVAICHPIKAKSILLPNRSQKIIIPIWITSYVISIPILFAYKVEVFIPGVPESTICIYQEQEHNMLKNFNISSAIILFILPMTIITVLYALIARVLNGNDKNINLRRSSVLKPSNKVKLSNKVKDEDKVDALRRQVVKLLAIVAICFAVCWFPYHLIRIMPMFGYSNWSEYLLNIYHKYLYFISISFLYVSAMINPILYNMMSKTFRHAFLQLIFGKCRRQVNRKCYNSLSRTTQMSSISSPV